MTGILQTATDANGDTVKPTDTGTLLDTGATVFGASTKPYDAVMRTVNPATDTVSGQLQTLRSQDSPYLAQAKQGAMEIGNSRGLLNSSITAGAGESAAINAALPIAQQDASTYTHVADTNQGFQNTAGQVNAGAVNTSNLNVAQAANTSGLSSQAAGQDVALQTLKGTQATTLANIEAQYKDTLQTSASAAQIMATTSQNINAILADPNTSTEQKQSAVNAANAQLQNSLAVVGGIVNLDLGSLLNFSGISP